MNKIDKETTDTIQLMNILDKEFEKLSYLKEELNNILFDISNQTHMGEESVQLQNSDKIRKNIPDSENQVAVTKRNPSDGRTRKVDSFSVTDDMRCEANDNETERGEVVSHAKPSPEYVGLTITTNQAYKLYKSLKKLDDTFFNAFKLEPDYNQPVLLKLINKTPKCVDTWEIEDIDEI